MPYTGIRHFAEEDVRAVADLHRRVMTPDAPAAGDWIQAYRNYFRDVFLSDAVSGSGLPSLVYQREGRIAGFLGVMPRRMLFQGRPLLAAVCSQFVVDPNERGQVGLQMLKRCFAGDQDLSFTDEAADCTRKIWEWCGGVAALPYSMHWVRPLRPAEAALRYSGNDARPAVWARALLPLARAVDFLVTRSAGRFRPAPPAGSREVVDDQGLFECLGSFAGGRSIGPAYDERSVHWMLQRLRQRVGCGDVRAMAVRDESNAITGCFVYHASLGGVAQVLQMAARPRHYRHVLDHLLDDAWQQDVVALAGRLDPAFAPELSENRCLVYRRGYWTLVQSRRQEISHALQRGDACLSRLEGEWCLRFS